MYNNKVENGLSYACCPLLKGILKQQFPGTSALRPETTADIIEP